MCRRRCVHATNYTAIRWRPVYDALICRINSIWKFLLSFFATVIIASLFRTRWGTCGCFVGKLWICIGILSYCSGYFKCHICYQKFKFMLWLHYTCAVNGFSSFFVHFLFKLFRRYGICICSRCESATCGISSKVTQPL